MGEMSLWNAIRCRLWGHEDILYHLAVAGHILMTEALCVRCSARLFGCACRTALNCAVTEAAASLIAARSMNTQVSEEAK